MSAPAAPADPADPAELPQAVLTPPRRGGLSAVWLIPLLAAVVAIGIAVQRLLEQGPTIGILFPAAAGIEARKTELRYKDVRIGTVSKVELTDDFTRVLVTARIERHAAGLMVSDARFWLVEPRVTLSGVTGLGTLLSGDYIGFGPGQSRTSARRFVALGAPPVVAVDEPGRQFTLTAADGGSIGVGAPVYYRRLTAGQVLSSELTPDGRAVRILVFVKAPYDRYVNADTRFWNASGIDLTLGADGLRLATESLVSVLVGGIAFASPDFAPAAAPNDQPAARPAAPPAAPDQVFTLHPDRASALRQPEAVARRYALYFRESLRGLSVGAPVTLLGLPIGEVTAVGFELAPDGTDLRGRVEVVTHPGKAVMRIANPDGAALGQAVIASADQAHDLLQRQIAERGLRAQLRSGSLVTGQMYIALDYFPHEPRAELDLRTEPPVVPTITSTLPNLEDKLTGILAKVDQIPFAAIGGEVKAALATLNRVLKDLDTTITGVNTGLTPEVRGAVGDLRRVLANADRVLNNVDAGLLGADAPVQMELLATLTEVSRAARSLRVLSDYLERHPEALLKGKGGR